MRSKLTGLHTWHFSLLSISCVMHPFSEECLTSLVHEVTETVYHPDGCMYEEIIALAVSGVSCHDKSCRNHHDKKPDQQQKANSYKVNVHQLFLMCSRFVHQFETWPAFQSILSVFHTY